MIVVSGLGRCGSSALMRMLKAGGIKLTANVGPPLFEDPRTGLLSAHDVGWLDRGDDWAVKILNPHIVTPPIGPDYRWIWLSRNRKHQYKSQIKTTKWMDQALRKDFSITRWTKLGQRYIKRLGGKVLYVTFEELLATPYAVADAIAMHVRADVDPNAMASVVRKRKPQCLPGMAEGHFKKGWGLP
jgi:hypothetical protein